MYNQDSGKHLTCTGCTLLSTEIADDKFHKFFTNILSSMKKRQVPSMQEEWPTVCPIWGIGDAEKRGSQI